MRSNGLSGQNPDEIGDCLLLQNYSLRIGKGRRSGTSARLRKGCRRALACVIWDGFAPAASHAASPVYRSFNHRVLIIAQPRFACRAARSPPFVLNRSSILAWPLPHRRCPRCFLAYAVLAASSPTPRSPLPRSMDATADSVMSKSSSLVLVN